MNNRFRVGEVSGLFNLPSSTLRYYDEIGLFKPKYTDPRTSYRYYGIEQFPALDTIIFLRKNGFSLKDIQQQLEKRTPETTIEILKNKLEEVRLEAMRLEKIEKRIENRISTIKEGLQLANNPTLIYQYCPKRAVSHLYFDKPVDLLEEGEHIYLKDKNQSVELHGFFTGDVGATVDTASLKQDGPIKYTSVFEILYEEEGKGWLDEGWYASCPHIGPYEEIKKSYEFALKQLNEEGYKPEGAPVEIYILDESVVKDPGHFVTLIQIPVVKYFD